LLFHEQFVGLALFCIGRFFYLALRVVAEVPIVDIPAESISFVLVSVRQGPIPTSYSI
jgi:hypothetical protein